MFASIDFSTWLGVLHFAETRWQIRLSRPPSFGAGFLAPLIRSAFKSHDVVIPNGVYPIRRRLDVAKKIGLLVDPLSLSLPVYSGIGHCRC